MAHRMDWVERTACVVIFSSAAGMIVMLAIYAVRFSRLS